MSHHPTQPPWGGPPPQPATNPYNAALSARPGWTRKRVLFPAAGVLFLIGVGIGAADEPAQAQPSAKPAVHTTVTATATETASPEPAVTETVTATPEPAPTVTRTKTVRVTVAPAAGGNGSGGSTGGGSDSAGSVYYRNCDAARAAGAAPVHAGDPGYGRHLDRDGDGVGCE